MLARTAAASRRPVTRLARAGVLLLLALLAATTSMTFAQDLVPVLTSTPTFAGVPWNAKPDAAKQQLVAKGYAFDHIDDRHDLWFRGRIGSQPVQIVEAFGPSGLFRTLVAFLTRDKDCRPTYDALLKELTTTYGAPSERNANWNGANFESAVKAGNAQFNAVWSSRGKNGGGILIEIEKNLTVSIYYDSASAHDALAARAKAAGR